MTITSFSSTGEGLRVTEEPAKTERNRERFFFLQKWEISNQRSGNLGGVENLRHSGFEDVMASGYFLEFFIKMPSCLHIQIV